MSSLIYCTEATQVYVATDTLAVSPNGAPHKFTSKAFIVPHLRLVLAGTGLAGFLGRWFVRINDRTVVKGIDHLDYHTPQALASLWQDCREELSIPEDITTTVYHFGFSEDTGHIHSYAYRSANAFRSERLQYGLGIKPECPVPDDLSNLDIRKMMEDQRAIQASLPQADRVYIGGEIEVHHLSDNGFHVCTLHRFEDYDQDQAAIYENFGR